MAICPSGHTSTAGDYCDTCGARIAGAPAPQVPTVGAAQECPVCGTPRSFRFCEECGHDFDMPGPPPVPRTPTRNPTLPPPGPAPVGVAAGTGWTAVINADRDYYEQVLAAEGPDAASIVFPPYCPERRVPLAGAQVRIGRHSNSRGTPEIDLSEPPGDPGVSRTHAVLLPQSDGGWTLVDPGSANGTTLNSAAEPVAVNVEIPLKDGDRIHVGAWTTITIQRG